MNDDLKHTSEILTIANNELEITNAALLEQINTLNDTLQFVITTINTNPQINNTNSDNIDNNITDANYDILLIEYNATKDDLKELKGKCDEMSIKFTEIKTNYNNLAKNCNLEYQTHRLYYYAY